MKRVSTLLLISSSITQSRSWPRQLTAPYRKLGTPQSPQSYIALRLYAAHSLIHLVFIPLGVLLAVDDFGTGYSSLAYLKALPVKRIKIDRAFVIGLPDNEQDEVLCRTMISRAHSFGCEVIAEGVETEAQADWLLASGCDELQGFLLGRPAPENHWSSQSMAR